MKALLVSVLTLWLLACHASSPPPFPAFAHLAVHGNWRGSDATMGRPISEPVITTLDLQGETLEYNWVIQSDHLPHPYYCLTGGNATWSATEPPPNYGAMPGAVKMLDSFHWRIPGVHIQRFERGFIVGPVPWCGSFNHCGGVVLAFADDNRIDIGDADKMPPYDDVLTGKWVDCPPFLYGVKNADCQ